MATTERDLLAEARELVAAGGHDPIVAEVLRMPLVSRG